MTSKGKYTTQRQLSRFVRRTHAPWRWVNRKAVRKVVHWMHPELFADRPSVLPRAAQEALAKAIASGTAVTHPWLTERRLLADRFPTPGEAVRGLQQTQRLGRRLFRLLGGRWWLRNSLQKHVAGCFRDQYRRDAIAHLINRAASCGGSRHAIREEVSDWTEYAAADDYALLSFRAVVIRELDASDRRDAEAKWEANARERRRRQREETRRRDEELARKRAEAEAAEAAQAVERARRAAEQARVEAADRRRRADAACGTALSKVSERAAILRATEHLTRQPIQAYCRRIRDSIEELRRLQGALQHDMDEYTLQRIHRQITKPFHPGQPHRCGSLARRLIIRVRDCGDFRDLAIVEMLRLMAVGSKDNGLHNKLWCSIDESRVVRLVYQDEKRPWCTVFTELEFQRASVPDHLNIVVSIHIPFGEGADPSAYPTEESTAHVRSTQTLTLVPKLIVSAGQSSQNQDEEVNEQSESARDTRSRSDRSSRTHRSTVEHRYGNAYSQSVRESEMETTGWTTPHEQRQTKDEGQEERSERSYSTHIGWDNSRSCEVESGWSSENETALRKRQSAMNQSQREVRVEFTPTAVGVDFSDASSLLGAWRVHPVNADASAVFDLLCHDLPGLAEALPDAIFERRRHERPGNSAKSGASNDLPFWSEVAMWAVIERAGFTPTKSVLRHDGKARPIDTAVVRSLVQGMRPELRGLTDQVFALPPGNNDDEW